MKDPPDEIDLDNGPEITLDDSDLLLPVPPAALRAAGEDPDAVRKMKQSAPL